MKIQLIGNIIDLSLIYQITPVVGNACWNEGASEELCRQEQKLFHSGYSFKIHFINQKSIDIRHKPNDKDYPVENGNISNSQWWQVPYDEYLKRLEKSRVELVDLHSKLSKLWADDESDLIKLEL